MNRKFQYRNSHFDDFVSKIIVLRDQYLNYLDSQSQRSSGYSIAKAQLKRRWKDPYGPLCYYVPFWYSYIFDMGESEKAMNLALANIYMYHYFTLKDDIIDSELRIAPSESLISDIIFGKSIQLYLETGLDGKIFLADLNRYLDEALEAELFLNRHRNRIIEYEGKDFIMMGKKAALLKTPASAFACVANKRDILSRLEEALLELSIGLQIIDDLKDWRHDFKEKNFTFPLVKALEASKSYSIEKINEEKISDFLSSPKVANEILMIAEKHFKNAKKLMQGFNVNYLNSFVDVYISIISKKQKQLKQPLNRFGFSDIIYGNVLLDT